MGFDPVRWGNFLAARIGSGQSPPPSLENFPQKLQIFLPSGQKNQLARVKKYLGQSQFGPLFIAGQKYAPGGSSRGPSLQES